MLWTGPDGPGDFVAILSPSAETWTLEPYFDTRAGNPGELIAPTTPGQYELRYFVGADRQVLATLPITVTPFVGSLTAPDEVEAGSKFDVEWTGPNGPGDFVTIVAAGTPAWAGESYVYTSFGTPGTLVAPIETGPHELWYVAGAEGRTMIVRPITVAPFEVTLDAPDAVEGGAQFEVAWTGPDGPSDYITIVPAGAPPEAYLSYAYTSTGSPVTLIAPEGPGDYEIRYASDRVDIVFGSVPITVN